VINHYKENMIPLPSIEFLIWFIGFAEGDGCFSITSRKNLHFFITQGTPNFYVLQLIQKTLGFGRVIKQGKRTYRFIVEQKIDLEKLI